MKLSEFPLESTTTVLAWLICVWKPENIVNIEWLGWTYISLSIVLASFYE